jgi:hypothetical protein
MYIIFAQVLHIGFANGGWDFHHKVFNRFGWLYIGKPRKYISLPDSKIETCMSVIYPIVIFFVGHTLICGG